MITKVARIKLTPGLPIRQCKTCGKLFIDASSIVSYCSRQCKKDKIAEKNRRQNERRRLARKKAKEEKERRAQEFEAKTKLARATGVHYGVIAANWHDKEKLKKIIEYEQKIGRAKPIDPKEKRFVGWRNW